MRFPASLLLAVALLGAGPPGAEPSARDVMLAAVRSLAQDRHGLVAFHWHYDYVEKAPAHSKTEVVDSGRLRKDGRLIAVRLYSQVSNGKTASASDLANAQAALDKQLPPDDYKLPLDEATLADYQFATSAAACDRCNDGDVRVEFTSIVRDGDHADGSAIVDARRNRIVRLDFHPAVLPPHTDSGTVAMTFGPVLPDLWDLQEITARYDGHMLFLHGYANVVQTPSAYRRFATMDEATRALAAGL